MELLSSNKKIKENKIKDYIVNNQESFYKIAYSYVKNKDDALDIVNDSICKALTKINSLNDIDRVKPWFYKILINSAIDCIRKKNKYIVLNQYEFENEYISNDVYSNIDLLQALDKLPEQYKTIIMLRYFEDMKIEDIAIILSQNINTVKTKLYKGLRHLRINMNKEDY